MHRSKVLIFVTATAASAVLLGGIGMSALPGAGHGMAVPAAFGGDKPDLSAEWDKQWQNTLDTSAKAYEDLFKWCNKANLESTANLVRRRALKYHPDDDELRKYFGYIKQPDGTYQADETRKDKLREAVDIDDPKATDFGKKELTAVKKVRDGFKSLAMKARKNGEAEPANAAAWKAKEDRAWERVLAVDPTNEEAHKALSHPKFEGKYCSPFAIEFLKARSDRKKAGLARATAKFPVKAVPVDGPLAAAKIEGAGAEAAHVHVCMQHGADAAATTAEWGERALDDFFTIHGVDPAVKGSLMFSFFMGKEQVQFENMLKSQGMNEKEVKRFTDNHMAGTASKFSFIGHNSGSADAHDLVMNHIGTNMCEVLRDLWIAELGSPVPAAEDWLKYSMGYDTTRRLTGTTLTVWGQFGKYGNSSTSAASADLWMELARLQVDLDDDVLLSRLYKKKLEDQQIKGPDIVKGYAFVQFVFETDPEKGREFVRRALVQGTPKAVEDVFQMSVDEIDAKYREWILKTW